MTLAPIDTLEVVKELKAAGFSEAQAEAVTRAVRKAQDLDLSHLATKHDLAAHQAATKHDLEATKADLEHKIEAVRADPRACKVDIRHECAALRADIKAALAELKADVIKWVLGIAFAQGAMIVALLELLPST